MANTRKTIARSMAVFVATMLCSLNAGALEALSESQMSSVSGTGLAFGFDDFDFRMAPTSFIELTGAEPGPDADAGGWRRGDLRYYGFSITGTNNGAQWYGNGCSNAEGLCPLGQGTIQSFAPVDNPYVFRAFQNPGFAPNGDLLANTGNDGGLGTPDAPAPTNLEFIGPTSSDPWKWSFWGEMEVDRNENNGTRGVLQSQTVIRGKNITTDGKPTRLRMFETQSASPTLGFTYQSALSGDFRFSVQQTAASPATLHEVPEFANQEGMYFKNVDAFLPLGTLHSQYVILDQTPASDGNFVIELTRIPDVPNVYNNIYCGAAKGDTCTLDANNRIANPNEDTLGYVRWGNWEDGSGNPINPYTATPGTGANQLPSGNSTANGMYFTEDHTNTTTQNFGISRVEGLRVQHMRITTLGVDL